MIKATGYFRNPRNCRKTLMPMLCVLYINLCQIAINMTPQAGPMATWIWYYSKCKMVILALRYSPIQGGKPVKPFMLLGIILKSWSITD